MEFATMAWMESFRDRCNADPAFQHQAKYADLKIALLFDNEFKGKQYYLKIYKGQIIDLEKFVVNFSPWGYDIVVRGDYELWKKVHSKETPFWAYVNNWEIEIGGNYVDAHRFHELVCIMCADILPTV